MFDPKYERFTHYELGGTYGNEVGQNGDQWFTSFVEDGPIARVTKDGVLSKFYPPTKGKPQRLQVDTDGTVWFTERRGGKIGHFDPQTESLKEYPYPISEISMRQFFLDTKGRMLYASSVNNKVGYFYLSDAAGRKSQ